MYVSITGRGTHFRLSLTCLISYHTIRHQHSATPHPNLHISRTSPYQARCKAWVQVEGDLQSPHTHGVHVLLAHGSEFGIVCPVPQLIVRQSEQ